MSTVLVVGAGAVGSRAALQLAATPGVERVIVADLDPERAAAVAAEAGPDARAMVWTESGPVRFPDGVSAVACALPLDLDGPVVTAALDAGIPVASSGETPEGVQRLLDLDDAAREAGVAVAVGAGLAPGLAEVLARYGADGLDTVEEVHVARAGVAGPASVRRRLRAARRRTHEVDGGAWVERAPVTARRLVPFPDPVSFLDCRRTASAVPRTVDAVLPGLQRVTAREALRWQDVLPRLRTGRRRRRDPLGALHVEVRGRRGAGLELLTYGAVDRMAAATGAVLAVATLRAAGLDGRPPAEPGARPVALLDEPARLLAELARRGVRAARFDGSI